MVADKLPPEYAAEIQRSTTRGSTGSKLWAPQRSTTSNPPGSSSSATHSMANRSPRCSNGRNAGMRTAFHRASGLHHPFTETLGTVASALAVRAHCSVEIVRR